MPLPVIQSAVDLLQNFSFEGVAAIGSLASAVAAWATVRSSGKTSREMLQKFEQMQSSARQSSNLNRSMQTVLHCNERYHDLEKERLSYKNDADKKDVDQFITRYWCLKSDQFDYWLAGFVDPDAFTTWFSSVAGHFFKPSAFIDGYCYRQLWIDTGRDYHRFINPWFVCFIDTIEQSYKEIYNEDEKFSRLDEIISSIEGTKIDKK